MKFRCKNCNRFVIYTDENKGDVACTHCGTNHSWLYENGWGYYAKDFTRKNCPLCGERMFVPRYKINIECNDNNIYFLHVCEFCKEELMGVSFGNSLDFVGYKKNKFSCEWCGNEMTIYTEDVNSKKVEEQNSSYPYKDEKFKCSVCGNKTKVRYFPWEQNKPPYLYIEKVGKAGRKKKLNNQKVEEFVKKNSLYQAYNLLHPFHIEEFIDDQHYEYDAVIDYLEEQGYEIFDAFTMEEKRELNVSEYESQFENLILTEAYLDQEGIVSLSRLLGRTNVWKNIRKALLEEYNNTCSICGFQTDDTKALHVHENWEVDKNIAILKSVELICSRCHACKHRNQYVAYRVMDGQSELDEGIPRIDMLTIHLMKVNNVSKEVIYAYRKKLFADKLEEERMVDVLRKETEDIKLKYCITDGIPYKKELEDYLGKRNLLVKSIDR